MTTDTTRSRERGWTEATGALRAEFDRVVRAYQVALNERDAVGAQLVAAAAADAGPALNVDLAAEIASRLNIALAALADIQATARTAIVVARGSAAEVGT
jgi:hypothetical protein